MTHTLHYTKETSMTCQAAFTSVSARHIPTSSSSSHRASRIATTAGGGKSAASRRHRRYLQVDARVSNRGETTRRLLRMAMTTSTETVLPCRRSCFAGLRSRRWGRP